MPAKHAINNDFKIITTTWEGKATDFDLIEALKNYYQEIKLNGSYSEYDEIVDFSKTDDTDLTLKGLIDIGDIASSFDRTSTNQKLAIIVNSDFEFSIANLYAFYRNMGKKKGKKIRVYKKKEEALEWIKNKVTK